MSVYEDEIHEDFSSVDNPDYWMLVESFFVNQNVALFEIMPWAWGANLEQSMGIAQTDIQNAGVVLADIMALSDSQALKVYFNGLVSDSVAAGDSLLPGLLALVAENVGVTNVALAAYAMVVIDSLGLTETVAPPLKYTMTTSEVVQWLDGLSNFFSGVIAEGMGITETLDNKMNVYPALTDSVGVTETLAQKLIFRVESADAFLLNVADLQKMIFNGQAADGIQISAAYIGPNGNFTTWAVNTKTLATSEYTNFAFNSFAQMGNKYVAADSSGIYELLGDTDNGAAIIADIKSGFAQFGGSRFSAIKAIYLGMRGSGDFVLKVTAGDGKTYNYAVSGKDMQTTRVHLGKGLRARYFAFELISTGQDFDLDDIEFVPLVAQRRV